MTICGSQKKKKLGPELTQRTTIIKLYFRCVFNWTENTKLMQKLEVTDTN